MSRRQLGTAAWILTMSMASAAVADVKYGVICVQEYAQGSDGPWLAPLTDSHTGCGEFHDELDPIGTRSFYWGTRNGEHHALEQGSPWESSVEGTDLLYIVLHAGAGFPQGANLAGYHLHDRAFSKKMRLGDNGRGLSVLAIYGCTTLAPYRATAGGRPGPESWWGSETMDYDAEERIQERWWSAMQGGLRMVVGSWDTLFISGGRTTSRNFGRYLADGRTIWEAWRTAVTDGSSGNEPAAMATGTSDTDCFNRLYGMKATNLGQYPRYRDNQFSSMCWTVDVN